MTPERWREVERLYHAAHGRPSEERVAFLREAAGGDEEVLAIVESLLAPEASNFLEAPPHEPPAVPGATLDTSRDLSSDLAESPHSFLRRRPWWVWCCALLATVAAAGWYWVVLAGPVPVGWELRPVKQPSTPLENSQSGTGWLQQELPRAERMLLRRARVEWLFPVLLGGTGAEAFLLVGPKRSEEPYSREDRMMLQAAEWARCTKRLTRRWSGM